MRPLIKSNLEKSLIVFLALTLVVYLTDRVLVSPMKEQMALMNSSIATAEQQLAKNQAIISRRHMIQQQYERFFSSASGYAADKHSLQEDWFKEIETAGRRTVAIKGITPLPDIIRNAYSWQSVEVSFEGKLDGVSSFVYDLLKNPHRSEIKSMRIRAIADQPGNLDCFVVVMRLLTE